MAIQTLVRAERDGVVYEEEFKGIYPRPNIGSEYADVVSHFLTECYAWQQCHIFTMEQPADNWESEDERMYKIFYKDPKHQRE